MIGTKDAPGASPLGGLVAAVLVVLLSSVIYSNTFSASFQFDDHQYVIDYNRVHGLSSFWPPQGTRYFTYLSFAINYALGGTDVFGYHLVNTAIHAVNGILVFYLAFLTMRTPRLAGSGLPSFHIALLASLLFTAHPVQTEAVTYISQRFASLATLFYLLSVVAYIKWRLTEGRGIKTVLIYAVSFLSAVAAQMTKEISFTLPFVIVVYELAFFTGPAGKRALALAPFVLAMGIIPYTLFGPDAVGGSVGDDVRVLQLRDLREISRHDYLVTQFRVIMTYLRLLVMPVGQTLEYDYPMYRTLFTPMVLASFMAILALFSGAIYLFIRFLRGGSAYLALISMGVAWFFTAISVESSIVPIKDLIFEHRLYLPSPGAMIAASALVFYLMGRFLRPLAALAVSSALIVAPLGAAAYLRNSVWKDGVTLYSDALKKSPGKERVSYNLAWAYHTKGDLDAALVHYEGALRINPGKEKAHYNMAIIYQAKNDKEKAEFHFRETLRLNPSHAGANYNLALYEIEKKDLAEAISLLNEAVKAAPGYEDAHYNLAWAYMENGDLSSAAVPFSTVLRINPASADALYNIGLIYRKEGDLGRAAKAFTEALRINPSLAEARAELNRILNSGAGL